MQEIKTVNAVTGEITVCYSNESEVVHGIGTNGEYLGLVPKRDTLLRTGAAPSNINSIWNFSSNTWEVVISLENTKIDAIAYVDNICGVARLKYITEIPGQQATYITKLQQAKDYLLDSSTVGAYLDIEAKALDISLEDAANKIISLSDLWNNIIGPKIEGIRIRSKLDINNATTIGEISTIKELTLFKLSLL